MSSTLITKETEGLRTLYMVWYTDYNKVHQKTYIYILLSKTYIQHSGSEQWAAVFQYAQDRGLMGHSRVNV